MAAVVQDTGPGFQVNSPAAPLEHAVRQATAEAHHADAAGAGAVGAGEASTGTSPAPTLRSQSGPGVAPNTRGEGIGLSIVKRLCELLDASLELETAPGTGSTFRVVLPRAYRRGGAPQLP